MAFMFPVSRVATHLAGVPLRFLTVAGISVGTSSLAIPFSEARWHMVRLWRGERVSRGLVVCRGGSTVSFVIP